MVFSKAFLCIKPHAQNILSPRANNIKRAGFATRPATLTKLHTQYSQINATQKNNMVIDFEKIAQSSIFGFKGGNGELLSRNFSDEKIKIMYSTLRPGASTGLHTHEGNSEVIFVISGTATFHYDGETEQVQAGQVHYCPVGHSHYMENLTDHDLVYFAIVPEHH